MPRDNFLFKALIAPHANMRYSGETAAKAFKYMAQNVDKFDRVVLLGPSHYAPFKRIGTTTADIWETPLGDINIDQDTIDAFIKFSKDSDFKEDITIKRAKPELLAKEHSLEAHLPFIMKAFKDAGRQDDLKLIPFIIGDFKPDKIEAYAKILLPLFLDPRTVFVISTDFVHWGKKFKYQPIMDKKRPFNTVMKLDYWAMQLLESQSYNNFTYFLDKTKATICGRRALQLLMRIIEMAEDRVKGEYETKFVGYDQHEPA